MKHLATTLIGALALYVVSPAGLAASSSDGVPQEVVRFADLDLTRPAGAQELYRRIQHAARDVCEATGTGPYSIALRYRDCTNQAIARAVTEVDAPLLTARYEATAGRQILQPPQARLNR